MVQVLFGVAFHVSNLGDLLLLFLVMRFEVGDCMVPCHVQHSHLL